MELELTALLILAVATPLTVASMVTTMKRHHERVERRLKLIMDHLDIDEYKVDMSQVAEFARQGKKIQAVKLHRQLTGSSLKEAKDAVERL